MTVTNTNTSSGPYAGNDIATDFSYTFLVLTETDIQVLRTDSNGSTTTLVLNTDYTLTGIGEEDGGLVQLTSPLPTGYTLFMTTDYELTQETDFNSQGAFFPDVHEDAFDKLTMILNQINLSNNKSVSLSNNIPLDGDMTIDKDASERASTLIGFDGNGNVVLYDADTLDKVTDVVVETETLSAGQTIVFFSNNVARGAFYISGTQSDNGRLFETTDYVLSTGLNRVDLNQSYPEGTMLVLVKADEVPATVNESVKLYDNVNNMTGANLQIGDMARTKGYNPGVPTVNAGLYYIRSSIGYSPIPGDDHVLANGNIAQLLEYSKTFFEDLSNIYNEPVTRLRERDDNADTYFNHYGGGLMLSPSPGVNIPFIDGHSFYDQWTEGSRQMLFKSKRTAADYTDTHTTYRILGQMSPVVGLLETSAGYQQNFTSDSGGRTMQNAVFGRAIHAGKGDCNAFFGSVSNNGHDNMGAISGVWTGQPSTTIIGGDAFANASKTNVYGFEFQVYNNAVTDNVTGIGGVIGLFRYNTVADYNHVWIGYRAQSAGSEYADVAFSAGSLFNVGFDTTDMITGSVNAAFTAKEGQRFYLGCAPTSFPQLIPTITGNEQFIEAGSAGSIKYIYMRNGIVSMDGMAAVSTGAGGLTGVQITATAGTASALPATPQYYMQWNLDGTPYMIPLYNI